MCTADQAVQDCMSSTGCWLLNGQRASAVVESGRLVTWLDGCWLISLSLDISITASAVGHQAEADGPVRPGEERGPAPHWAVDGGQPLQRHSGGVEPRVTGHYQPVPHSSNTHTHAVASYLIHPSFFFWSSVMLISPFGLLCVQTMVKTFELCDLPVRVAKFVARKHWVIAGAVSVWTQWERPCAY